jgi:DNA-binding MarR family transcriptional regulator
VESPASSPLDDGGDPIAEVIDQAMDLTVRHLADRTGLSGSAAMLLNRLVHEGPARLTTLACLEGISQPAMTQMIQRLERQGLVQRSSDPDDGRAAVVALAADGRVKLALSSEDEFSLVLAAQVALPILRRLNEDASAAATGRLSAIEADCAERASLEQSLGGKS